MAQAPLSEEELVETHTGRVVESLAVKQDFGTATVGCRRCEPGPRLAAGDEVTVALSCYENHSWEIEGVYCRDHAVASVAGVMAIRAEHQTVVSATLASGEYRLPRGGRERDALTLDHLAVLDYSPPAEGYGDPSGERRERGRGE